MFTIRKDKSWRISSSKWWMMLWIIFTLVWGAFTWIMLYSFFIENNNSSIDFDLLLVCCVPLIFFFTWLFVLRSELKMRKAKKFKENGNWILKRLPVTSIWYYRSSWWKNSKWYSWYYLEIETDDMIYCSDWFEDAIKEWISKEDYRLIYTSYGFDFDEKYKNDVLRKIDEDIANKEYDAENSWFLSKWFKKTFVVGWYKTQREAIEKWYEPEKMCVNWNEVKVWDMVDIYIDPEDPKNYYVDVDFLKKPLK